MTTPPPRRGPRATGSAAVATSGPAGAGAVPPAEESPFASAAPTPMPSGTAIGSAPVSAPAGAGPVGGPVGGGRGGAATPAGRSAGSPTDSPVSAPVSAPVSGPVSGPAAGGRAAGRARVPAGARPGTRPPAAGGTTPVPVRPGRRLLGLPVGRLVLVQLLLVAVLVSLAGPRPVTYAVGGVAVLVLVLAFLRTGGRWWTTSVRLRRRLARRVRRAPVADADPRLTALRRLCPALTVHGIEEREQRIGVGGDGAGWFTVLAVRPTSGAETVPVDRLTRLLTDRDVRLDAVQAVLRTVPAGAGLDPDSLAARSYRELAGGTPPPISRQLWVALRFDPGRDPAAVQRRGDGITGVHRVLAATSARAVKQLASAGLDAAPLEREALLDLLARSAGLRPGGGDAIRETWAGVEVGARRLAVHRATRLGDLAGPGADVVAALSGVAVTTEVSVLLRRDRPGQVRAEVSVRLGGSGPQVAAAADALRNVARAAGAVLRPAQGEHGPATFATAPTGGGA